MGILTNSEPAQCYKRLICDLSAGAIQDKDQIVTLFNGDVSPISPKFEFATAARVGKIVKSAQVNFSNSKIHVNNYKNTKKCGNEIILLMSKILCVSVMYGEINKSLGEDLCDPAREKRILPPP